MADHPARYDAVSKWLHWSAAGLLIGGFLVAENTSHRFAEATGYGVHASTGLALLALTVFRVYWRLSHVAPAYPASMKSAEKWAASAIKLLFYTLMVLIPLSGLAAHAVEFRGQGALFGVLPLPGVPVWLVPGDAEDIHELASHMWLPLLAIHVIAAIWHHFVRRDDALTRMLPGRQQ
jgi:cytochrome b561